MIASVFKKSKPINFVLILAILFLVSFYAVFYLMDQSFSIPAMGSALFVFAICVFTLFLINFIVVKNKLIESSGYHIFFYGMLLTLFPFVFTNENMLLANVFILLALRRLISIRSQINIKKKLFDASFWIGVATLFYFWSILFFLLVFATLFLFSDNRIKNWIIPFTGLATVFVLVVTYYLLKFDSLELIYANLPYLNFDFTNYYSIKLIVSIILLLTVSLWATIFYIRSLKDKLRAFKPSHKIVVGAVVIALGSALLSENKDSSEYIFMLGPLSIIIGNYVESIQKNWLKEVFVYIFIVVPVVLLML